MSPSLLEGSKEHIRKLHRQHKITIRRLDAIQRHIDQGALSEEAPEAEEPKGIVAWFKKLVGY